MKDRDFVVVLAVMMLCLMGGMAGIGFAVTGYHWATVIVATLAPAITFALGAKWRG